MRLPSAILSAASATPPRPSAHAESTLPARIAAYSASRLRLTPAASKALARSRHSVCPAALNSGEMTSPLTPGAMAKLTSVGGTSRFSKVPLMESLPPMAATPKSICASSAPSRAASGLPQRSGAPVMRSKYS